MKTDGYYINYRRTEKKNEIDYSIQIETQIYHVATVDICRETMKICAVHGPAASMHDCILSAPLGIS